MNGYEAMFILQFFLAVGILLFKMYNIMTLGKFYDLKIGFIVSIGYLLCWLVSLIILAEYPTKLLYSILFELESWLIIVNALFLIFEIFFKIRDTATESIGPRMSNEERMNILR